MSSNLSKPIRSDAASLTELLRIKPKRIDVAFLPTLIHPDGLAGRTAIVTDVLRATTTTINAIHNGCTQVIPAPSIESARALHANTANSVLGGERGGKIIPGFHHGNSPLEYVNEKIAGKSVILATTNGTVAMEHCRFAKRVLIGAMVNIGALVEKLTDDEPITIICSGTDGEITSEDTLFAGALVERILLKSNRRPVKSSHNDEASVVCGAAEHEELSDMALIALSHWRQACILIAQGNSLASMFTVARGGVNLVKIGLQPDIEFAAQIDSIPIVPELNVEHWSISLNQNQVPIKET